ncbi:MAG: hypothetical protein NC040_09815 [Muribaculaceae bacterium]|nr:hypothetical protein [Alistipes senegalensis]MCM1474344.1 hypothetical protein [Muribaculaceae bacterium]
MKKILSAFLSSAILLFSVSTTVSAGYESEEASYTITSASKATEFYKSVMKNPEWSATSRKERGEKLQLPEKWLENMTTSALIDAVVEYPYFSDVYFFDNVKKGAEVLYYTFNGVRELADRPDVATVLLQKYKDENILTDVNTSDDIFRLTDIEILLSLDFVREKLTDDEISELSNIAFNKYNKKNKSEIYGEFTENIFYDLIGVDTNSENLVDSAESAMSYDSVVYTPNGSPVSVIVDRPELSYKEITELNAIARTGYPNAERLREPTNKYNCHSYAWYSQSSSNNKWMNNPYAYISDGSYYLSSNPQSNYRMVYWQGNSIEHSAIIETRLSGGSNINFRNMVIVISKWGNGGLYRHNGNDSPYYYCDTVSYYN